MELETGQKWKDKKGEYPLHQGEAEVPDKPPSKAKVEVRDGEVDRDRPKPRRKRSCNPRKSSISKQNPSLKNEGRQAYEGRLSEGKPRDVEKPERSGAGMVGGNPKGKASKPVRDKSRHDQASRSPEPPDHLLWRREGTIPDPLEHRKIHDPRETKETGNSAAALPPTPPTLPPSQPPAMKTMAEWGASEQPR